MKEEKPKVSIIIPVYNVEPYIEQCIKSVLGQTYRQLEVILVDDCGKDRSMDVAKDCIEKSANGNSIKFVYLYHNRNLGPSAARNTGIKASTGEWLYFLDSDDWIIPECIELMMECVEKYPDVEMVYAGAKVTEGSQWLSYEHRVLPDYSDDRDWINKALLQVSKLNDTAWNKLARKSFIIEKKLYFEEGYIHEDDIWNFEIAKHISKIAVCQHDTYVYVIRERSLMSDESQKDYHRMRLLNYYVNHVTPQYRRRQISFIFFYLQYYFPEKVNTKYENDKQSIYKKLMKESKGRQKLALWIYFYVTKRVLRKIHLLGFVMKAIGKV